MDFIVNLIPGKKSVYLRSLSIFTTGSTLLLSISIFFITSKQGRN
jgi:hypothetical protein